MVFLVTGCAGFIGMHTCLRLLTQGNSVIGLDNLCDYYDVSLKEARLRQLSEFSNFSFHKVDVSDRTALFKVFHTERPTHVIHLAAQAGVRYSISNPDVYVESNLVGFLNVLEGCRHGEIAHLVYASSSSVYGGNQKLPFAEQDSVDHPVSLYAATKRANELMAHTYSHLFRLPTTGLRFFTVYGPWGRPDMALFRFAKAIFEGTPIDVYNNGQMVRDFTFIDDIVEGILRVVAKPAISNEFWSGLQPDPASSNAPFLIFNMGNSQPVQLLEYIAAVESATGKMARKNYLPMQPGDVLETSADTLRLERWIDFRPSTPVAVGVQQFIDWYIDYYDVKPHH